MVKFILGGVTTLVVMLIIAYAVLSSGRINVGADHEHSPIVYSLIEKARINSMKHAGKDIIVPKLDEPAMISAGGADYKDMCVSCHLSPDVTATDLSLGLYPKPPNFTDPNIVSLFAEDEGAKQGFWAIKHGIMASGMPAWGATHDDDRMWAMMAFIKTLPNLTADQYTMLTTRFDAEMMGEAMDGMMDDSMNDMMDESIDGMSGDMQH